MFTLNPKFIFSLLFVSKVFLYSIVWPHSLFLNLEIYGAISNRNSWLLSEAVNFGGYSSIFLIQNI